MDAVTQGVFTAVGNYIVIALTLVMSFFINWIVRRIKCLVLCMVAIMQGQIAMGVNGDIKKRYDALIEQITKD
jgi:polyferredoxin